MVESHWNTLILNKTAFVMQIVELVSGESPGSFCHADNLMCHQVNSQIFFVMQIFEHVRELYPDFLPNTCTMKFVWTWINKDSSLTIWFPNDFLCNFKSSSSLNYFSKYLCLSVCPHICKCNSSYTTQWIFIKLHMKFLCIIKIIITVNGTPFSVKFLSWIRG